MICLLAALLSGCSYAPHETRAAYEPVTDATATAKPLAQLPAEAGAIVSVLESRVAGIYTQRVVLAGDTATDGENVVIVQIDESERRPADLSALAKLTADGIAQELDANFPSIDMQISRAWNHNEFGPFGYAIGKAPRGATCIYAWQFAPGATPHLIDDPTARGAAASMPSAPMSVRVRLCRQALSEQELVALVRAMQVYPLGGGAPYNDTIYAGIGPLGAGDALQAAGAPGEFFLRPTAPPTSIKKHKSAKTHRRVARDHVPPGGENTIALRPGFRPSTGVVVPLPSGSVGSTPATAANPLLAPLAGAPQQRAAPATDDMPLPGAAAASNLAQPSSPRPGSSIPLPN